MTAEDVNVGVVSWCVAPRGAQEINRHLRTYIDVSDVVTKDVFGGEMYLVHRSGTENGKPVSMHPFQRGGMERTGPFYFPNYSSMIVGAVYVTAKGMPPTWFQLEVRDSPDRRERPRPSLVRTASERCRVSWFLERGGI